MKNSFSINQVANSLGVSRVTIHRELSSGKLEAAKVGGQYLITRPDLEKYLGSQERVDSIFGESKINLKVLPNE